MEKGTVRLVGQSAYEIDVSFALLHDENCATCETIFSRGTGTRYNGLLELGNALDTIVTHYAYAIRYDSTYIHAKRIHVNVFEIRWGNRIPAGEYEITPEVSKL